MVVRPGGMSAMTYVNRAIRAVAAGALGAACWVGAASAAPVGFASLMFAPFPWQATNLRQAITIPEVLIWWAMIPFLVMGLIYAVKHRLRNAFPVLIFSLLLTLAYSIFQGNVGTAYRRGSSLCLR